MALEFRFETFIIVGSMVIFGLWAMSSVVVVFSRGLHDRRRRRLDEISRTLTDPSVADLPPLRRAPAAQRLLSRRSRWDVYRMVARGDSPPWLTELCAAYTLEHVGLGQLVADAARESNGRKWRRVAALLALGHVHAEQTHDLLEAAIRDDDLDIASAAAAAFRRLGDRRAAAALVTALEKGHLPRSRLATHLEQFPLPLDAFLRPLLSAAEPEVRQWAASLLTRYPEVEGLAEELAASTRDPHPPVRKCALQALGTMFSEVALAAGRHCLDDPVSFVRSAAIRLLGAHGASMPDPRRIEVSSWIAPSMADAAWEVRLAAKESLTRLGPTVWREAAAQLESQDAFARNGAAEVLMNMGVLDSTLRGMVGGPAPTHELRDVLRRALREGGSEMAEAMKKRSRLEALPEADLDLVEEPEATTR